MNLYQLAVPKDDAQSVMNELGDVGLSHFVDLNNDESPYNLPYTQQIKACELAERSLGYLQGECKKHNIKINPPKNIDGFLKQLKIISDNKKKALNLLFEEIQREISNQEAFIITQSQQLKEAESTLHDLMDCIQVMRTANEMLPGVEQRFQQIHGQQGPDIEGGNQQQQLLQESVSSNFSKIAGVIESTEVERLKRLVFRATKGKSFVFTQDFFDQANGQQVARATRSVYIIMYWDGDLVRDKIQRICDSFTGNRYELPDMSQMQSEIARVTQRIEDARNVFF